MLGARCGKPLPRRADGRLAGHAGTEEDAEPAVQAREAFARLDGQHTQPGKLGGRARRVQEPRPAGARRTHQHDPGAGAGRHAPCGGVDAGELGLPAVELAEPDPIGRQPVAFGIQGKAGRGREGLDHFIGLGVAGADLPRHQLGHHGPHPCAGARRRHTLEVGTDDVGRCPGGEGIRA